MWAQRLTVGTAGGLLTRRTDHTAGSGRHPQVRARTPEPAGEHPLLRLQRQAGNQAVNGLLLQRKASLPPPKTPRKKSKIQENSNHYLALCIGIDSLSENWRRPKAIDFSPLTASDLHPRHRELLVRLNAALLIRGTDPQKALEQWQPLERALRAEIAQSAKFPAFTADVRGIPLEQIATLGEKTFVAGAYYAAKSEKKAEGHLEAPDKAALAAKLEKAEGTYVDAKKMYEEAAKLGAEFVTSNSGLKKIPGGDVVELVLAAGSIEEKLAAARKGLGVGTVADLAAKVSGVSANLMKQTSSIGVAYCAKMGARAVAKGATEQAANLKSLGTKFGALAGWAEKVSKGASILSVLNDYKNLVTAIANRDFDAAMSAAADLAVDGAPLVFGGALAAPLAASVVVVKAQLEAIHLAAAFIRWCKDETVRLAALDFVEDCTKLAKSSAYDLVADAEIILDPTKSAVHHIAEQQLIREGKRVATGLAAIASHVQSTEKTSIGGYARVRDALGKDALNALWMPHEEPLIAADQVAAVFKGANQMATFVKHNYKN